MHPLVDVVYFFLAGTGEVESVLQQGFSQVGIKETARIRMLEWFVQFVL